MGACAEGLFSTSAMFLIEHILYVLSEGTYYQFSRAIRDSSLKQVWLKSSFSGRRRLKSKNSPAIPDDERSRDEFFL